MPELRTERLLMRGWTFEDYEPLAEILADPAVGAGLGKPTASRRTRHGSTCLL